MILFKEGRGMIYNPGILWNKLKVKSVLAHYCFIYAVDVRTVNYGGVLRRIFSMYDFICHFGCNLT